MNFSSQAIGLGYTLFMRDSSGRTVRVDPGHEFHNGDRVRISLEPNVDGFLYVFHTEGTGAPEMIYPDPRLDGGENWIEAHVPMEVPSSEQADERYHWFVFDNNPATERLYVVITRKPLPLVPTGSELVTFCSANNARCPWRPVPEVWAQLQDANKAEVKVVASHTFGQSQTEKEQVATTRGLGLDQSAEALALAEEAYRIANGFDLIAHHIVAVEALERLGGVFRVLHGDYQNAGEVVGGAGDDGVGFFNLPVVGELNREAGCIVGVGVGEGDWRQQKNGQRDDEQRPDHEQIVSLRPASTMVADQTSGQEFWRRRP